jgi:two-component sensor histidine kinase
VEVGYIAAEALGRTLGAGSAAFASVSRDGQTLKVERAWAAPGVQRLEGEFHMPDFGVFYEEISRGEMLVVHDAANDPRATKGPDGLARAGAQAFISLPIMEYGRFVAMISVNASGPRMWDEGETGFARAVADLAYSARARALAEAEQKVVNQEIGHRLKNSLVMVQSIARQTLGAAAPGPLAAFEQRLQALSAAHDLLFRDEWDSADMAAVAARTLHAVALAERFEITGPPVWLGAKATLSLSLVLHEMATNAAKYGALSNAAGKVVVDWTVEGQDLSFRWREVGGPTVTPPDKTGFGSRLIQLGLAGGGQATLRYPETGFEAELSAPLERLRGA